VQPRTAGSALERGAGPLHLGVTLRCRARLTAVALTTIARPAHQNLAMARWACARENSKGLVVDHRRQVRRFLDKRCEASDTRDVARPRGA
jgi:hypothetical protein